MDNRVNGSFDLISLILILYLIRYVIWRIIELFLTKNEISGVVSAKRTGFLNLFHWVTIEHNGSRVELNISRAQVGLMSTGDILQIVYRGGRVNKFEIIKSNYSTK